MKFTKINDNCIRCIVTKQEMCEYGVEVAELISDREKTEDLLRKIMLKARYELDFKTGDGMLSVQIVILPDGDLSMTISETSKNDIKNKFNELKDYIEMIQDMPLDDVKEEVENKQTIQSDILESKECIWTRLGSMDDCFKLCKNLKDCNVSESSLHKFKDRFYFRFKINDKDNIGKAVMIFLEFSEQICLESNGPVYILEHGETIIEKDALNVLNNL